MTAGLSSARRPFAKLALVVRCLAGVLVLEVANAADLPGLQPPAKGKLSTPAAVSIQAYGQHDRMCQTWTDGCRNCERAGSTSSCSNIGIACQPGAIRCTARTDAAQ